MGDIPTGVGLTGRGKKPPPLSLLSICQHPPPQEGVVQAIPGERPYPGERTHTPVLSSGSPHTLDRGGYTPVGAGAVVAIPGERPYPGRIPIPWTVGGILLWGWGKSSLPLPLLSICQLPLRPICIAKSGPGSLVFPCFRQAATTTQIIHVLQTIIR